MSGEVGILNVGAGDTKLVFDPTNPQEMIRAARIVKDMIRRGYALLVEVKNPKGPSTFRRAYDFDEKTCEYIIADLDPVAAQKADEEEAELDQAATTSSPSGSTPSEETSGKGGTKAGRRKSVATKRVHASTTRTVAVGRTAGG